MKSICASAAPRVCQASVTYRPEHATFVSKAKRSFPGSSHFIGKREVKSPEPKAQCDLQGNLGTTLPRVLAAHLLR